ncbi:3-mercaptopyruvate sulfurtransferase [Alphaproteobacteria bacterium]|jgi:thiosulfate/3-mercaptopyruvate sulfurtransferase|nr:3-mercaptopyruvate sulfurtransferase [Alphaproteobacteria bacterium]
MVSPLVSADWLKDNLNLVKILDATYHLTGVDRDPEADFAASRIPGANRFDINKVADTNNPLPHMLPDAETFATAVAAMGISDHDHVIVYDDSAIMPATRAWWMFRLFGHERISVLDGGLAAWRRINGPLDTDAHKTPIPGNFTVRPSIGAQVIDMAAIEAMMAADSLGQLADARSASRFSGEAPEPRAGLRSGHIPGASNVPLSTLVSEDGTFRSPEEISAAFRDGGIDPEQPIITSCGSGVTACGLALGLALIGNEKIFVYDGSWTEWGGSEAPIETGT